MSKNLYQLIMKCGIFMSLVSVFLVYNGFLFPYITSKQIYFNILVEFLSIFWIVFLLKYPEERPKKTWVHVGLVSYFSVVLLTCFSGVDFNLSFWGDIERMLGFFHIVHFLILYFIVITVMREWRDWKYLFLASVVCAEIVAINGLTGKAFSTIGNTAYVAGYLIFNIFFVFILFFREERKSLRWLYLLFLPLMIKEFILIDSSGGTMGLGIGVATLGFIYGFFSKNTIIKRFTLGLSVFIVVTLIVTFTNRELVSDVRILNKLNTQKNTFQTRMISWRAAMQDLPNHYLLGTGFGNYAITFDRYFEPTFYDFTRSETYFDRAHNNIIEIVSTTGLLGLVAYLSIFLAVGLMLIRGYRDGVINLNEFALISALLVAYFVQNLAVFDSLVTYTALMMTLGYVYWLRQDVLVPGLLNDPAGSMVEKKKLIMNRSNEVGYLVVVGFVVMLVIYNYNIQPIKMLKGTIAGQIAFAHGDLAGAYEKYQKALSYETGLDRDARGTYAREISAKVELVRQLDEDVGDRIVDYAVELSEANVVYNEEDSLAQMQLAQMYSSAASYYSGNADKSLDYFQRANKAIDASIEASPGRIRTYFAKTQILLSAGRVDEAIKVLEYAISLNENYYDSYCYLGSIQLASNNKEVAYEAIDRCLDLGGQSLLQPASVVLVIMEHYKLLGEDEKVVKLLERLSDLEPNNAIIEIELAKYYVKIGNIMKAREAALRAAELDASVRQSALKFVEQLED